MGTVYRQAGRQTSPADRTSNNSTHTNTSARMAAGSVVDATHAFGTDGLADLGVFPLLKSLLPVVVAFLLPTTDTLDHHRVGNGTHRHGLFQEPMEELPAMA